MLSVGGLGVVMLPPQIIVSAQVEFRHWIWVLDLTWIGLLMGDFGIGLGLDLMSAKAIYLAK